MGCLKIGCNGYIRVKVKILAVINQLLSLNGVLGMACALNEMGVLYITVIPSCIAS